MTNFILKIFILISFSIGYSQSNDSICNLQKRNTLWKNEFPKLSLSEKIESLKNKIEDNSNYLEWKPVKKIIGQYNVLETKAVTDRNGNNCLGHKMLFLVSYKSGKIKIVDINQNEKWKSVVQKFNSENIKDVDFFFNENSEKKYGMLGGSGTIVIYIGDKKLEREINKIVM